MVKWVVGGWLVLGIVLWPVAGPSVAGAVAFAWLVVGLLVVIAINVQPKTAEHRDKWAMLPKTHETDADLFEEFDDPYDEPAEPQRPPVRVNRRQKHRV